MDAPIFRTVTRTQPPLATALEPYLLHLRALPFVKKVRVLAHTSATREVDAVLEVVTPSGKRQVSVEWKKSHLSRDVADRIASALSRVKDDVLVLAPVVGPNVGERLKQAGVGYLDLAGNCDIQWGQEYVAHVEGRRPPERAPEARALRVPSLLVLFTLLARPDYVGASTRQLGQAAGVSPQTATDLRKRLIAEGCIIRNGRDHFWAREGKGRALGLLEGAYPQLAASLRISRFRARPGPVEQVEQQIADNLKAGPTWSWGGGAALQRWNGYYRGARTIVYLDAPLPSAMRGLVPDDHGEVIFARPPGQCAHDESGQISPLLVYLDLLAEGEPRAREAAEQLRPKLLQGAEA
jgi:hypothetical protein